MFNDDRGLIDPYNGIYTPTGGKTSLKQQTDQKYFEGPDVYGDFVVSNELNDLEFITQTQNLHDEVKQLDATLFSTGLDDDVQRRLAVDDIRDKTSNIMGFNASDGMRLLHQAATASNRFENQIALLPDAIGQGINATSKIAQVLEKLDTGRYELKLPTAMSPDAQRLIRDIIANPKSVVERGEDIVRLVPEYSNKLHEYLELAVQVKDKVVGAVGELVEPVKALIEPVKSYIPGYHTEL